MVIGLGFRPILEADRDFLYAVYASTRQEELKLTDWDESGKAAFLDMQFSAQHQHYQQNYKNTDFLIVMFNDMAIGRFYIARWLNEIRIVDLSLLPEYRNRGYGSKILNDVLDEAAETGKNVSIHVERFNPARNLYFRLGFEKKGEHGIYDFLEWSLTRSKNDLKT